MSRAPSASFAQFFPSAPKAAKDKAKEREKVKSLNQDSPSTRPVADTKLVLPNFRIDDAPTHYNNENNPPATDNAALVLEEGDILNGVGSASSHSSTVSSVFSAAAQQSNLTANNQNISMTPMTNLDSSPSRVASPYQYKSATAGLSSTGIPSEKRSSHYDVPQPHNTAEADQPPSDPRVYARDPSRGVKGNICTYDPNLDRKISSNEKKKAKPIYKDIGLVRIIQSAVGVVILFV